MARSVNVWNIRSWDGGLNLRDDAFQISENELADTQNVRVLPQGGIERRRGYTNFSTFGSLSTTPANVWGFLGNGVKQVVVQQGSDISYADGTGAFTAWDPDALVTTGVMRAATMATLTGAGALNVNDESLYIQRNAEQVPLRFRGSGASSAVLADAAAAFNDSITAPAGGRMPVARYIATHQNYLWHAYTVEGGNTYKNRVRWSHPGEPEDYRTNDYIDVDTGVDGDEITGIAGFGDRLFVFKTRSVYAISGYSPETFEVFPVVQGIGAASQEAVAAGRFGLAFYDPMMGVFLLNQKGETVWLWEKIHAKILDGTIQNAYWNKVVLAWLDERLFVSVPWASPSTVNTRTFVYDPKVGREGAWYTYEFGVGPMIDWRPTLTTQKHLACAASGGVVYSLESSDAAGDTLFGVTAGFPSSFKTGWFDARLPARRKRWRRPQFVLDNDLAHLFNVKVWTDYSTASISREFNMATSPSGGSMLWGDDWGEEWGAGTTGDQAIKEGTGLGRAYAVQLQVTSLASPATASVTLDATKSSGVWSTDAVYATARDGGGSTGVYGVVGDVLAVGQLLSGNYTVQESFFEFGGTIPGGATPTTAVLRLRLLYSPLTNPPIINVGVYDFGAGPPTVGDFRNQAALSTITPIGSYDTANLPALGEFFDIPLDASGLPVGTPIRLVLWAQDQEDSVAPTGTEDVWFYNADGGPTLDVVYAIENPWGLNEMAFKYIPQRVR